MWSRTFGMEKSAVISLSIPSLQWIGDIRVCLLRNVRRKALQNVVPVSPTLAIILF